MRDVDPHTVCNAALHHCGKWYRIRQKVNQDLFDTVLLSRSSEIFKFTTYGNFLILMSQELLEEDLRTIFLVGFRGKFFYLKKLFLESVQTIILFFGSGSN